jgi:Glutathione-dependent formaldehyde-activating enzyme
MTTGSDHGGETQPKFCSACGSPVFSIAAVAPDLVFIKTGSLDDASRVGRAGGGGMDQLGTTLVAALRKRRPPRARDAVAIPGNDPTRVEPAGFEPAAFALQTRRSTN